jgi:hypothetical protein
MLVPVPRANGILVLVFRWRGDEHAIHVASAGVNDQEVYLVYAQVSITMGSPLSMLETT